MGRFLTRDSWQGDYIRPASLNKWIYVEGNPIIFVDPLGMSKRSYLIYFPGIGNNGNNPDENETQFINMIKKRTEGRVDILTIYPYGIGLANQGENKLLVLLDAAYGNDKGVTEAKANQILNYVNGGVPVFYTLRYLYNAECGSDTDYDKLNEEVKVNFLGYSGGGQIAYTTAQRLAGRLFVDNLILFGSPWRAYNGTNNIGHIWEFWAKGDLDLWGSDWQNNYGGAGYYTSGWREYNEGWRVGACPFNDQIGGLCRVYHNDLNIYESKSVKRIVLGDSEDFNHNSYFSPDVRLKNGKTMREELLDYLIDTVGLE